MIIHPVWLVLAPIFFIEMLALKYLPILGIIPPITLIVMVLNVHIISISRIWLIAVVFGYVTDVLAGVDKGAHFLAWMVCAGILSLIQLYDPKEKLSLTRTSIYALVVLSAYQFVLYLFVLEIGFKYWITYVSALLGVSLVTILAVLFAEKAIERARS